MAATLTQERFTGPEWIFERKLDGIRLLAFKNGADVRLLSRNRLPQTPPGDRRRRSRPARARRDPRRRSHVGAARRSATTCSTSSGSTAATSPSLPLDDAPRAARPLPLRPPLQRVPSLDDPKPWERACREGWEGVIAKRRDSPYEHRRSPHWLKMKCEASQELVVGGFTDPQGARVGLGALLVGYFEGDDFVFAGKVGTGFDTRLLLESARPARRLEIPTSPFTRAIGLPRLRAHWVRPEIVVQVAFIEWTVHGKLRHPRLLGVRADKAARDVVQGARRDHASREGAVSRRRHHERRARRLLRVDRAGDAAAHPRAAR